jgi:SpoIID/LytB domain protein
MTRARILLAFLVAVSLVAIPAGPAHAARTFKIYGAGNGHGLGLSQWGAYGLATKGLTHQQILTHYYTGTEVVQGTGEPTEIRVGLTDGRRLVHLTAEVGQVELRLAAPGPTGTLVGTIPSPETWTVEVSKGNYLIRDAHGTPVGTAVDGTKKLYVVYEPAGARVSSPEAGHTYNRGYIEMSIYRSCSSCTTSYERMVAVLAPQSYLYGLGEVPNSWPVEALEAQIDAARTYAYFLIKGLGQNRSGCACGLFDDARNQVYAGWDHEGDPGGEQWVQAVDATDGEVVTYNGQLIEALYMSSSGGYTENNENVWGGTPQPYLRGVCDPGDYTDSNPYRVWTVSLTDAAVTSKLLPYTGDIGTVVRFRHIIRGVSGRVMRATVVGAEGTADVAGATLRGALGLRDTRFWINTNRTVTGTVRAKYDALKCAPGLPTTAKVVVPGGSRQRFQNGAIYANEADSRTVWLRGPIYSEYVVTKESEGPLGPPLSSVVALTAPPGCDTQSCAKARFKNGFIYFKEDTGAHEVHGPVLEYFAANSGVFGHLGFPITDVKRTARGVQATFQGRGGAGQITVTCPASGGCTES